jgi:HPt (histidine-containing phosphotransfer) domain-containing protein
MLGIVRMLRDRSAEPHPAAFDASRLIELLGNDRGAMLDVLHTAFESLQEMIKRLAIELAAGNRPTSLAGSHELKGVSANVGADELAALASALETRLCNSDSIDLEDYAHELDAAFIRLLGDARAFLVTIDR